MTGQELIDSVCDDAIRIFELRLENRAYADLYQTEEFERIRKKMRDHALDYSDEQVMELILMEYSERLKKT